ncbi:MAG: M6 family metalloprotease domain-containing protein [Bacteroidaceae bacterium]|nr:M6 family metalloprotease domain-containing protein [Bacteroidaceae bacterium]
MRRLTLTIMAMLLGVAIFYARPAYRSITRVSQPDGSTIDVRLVGDEYLHYNVTTDGYSLIRRDDGAFVYAQLNDKGQLEPTTMLAHDVNERSTEERKYLKNVGRLLPQPTTQAEQMRSQNQVQRARMLSQRRAALYDYSQFRGLVLLVEYNDCAFRYNDYADIMEDMINADNYTGNNRTNISSYGIRCTGSIRDYYRDNSDGIFVPTFDVVGPVKVDHSQYYVNSWENATQLMVDACTAADSLVNFSDYDVDEDGMVDMVYFIFSGLGSYIQGNDSRLLWPHQSDISYERNVRMDGVRLGRYACSTELFGTNEWSVLEGIGTMCHEFSHVLGLPDFYDTGNQYDGECVTPDAWSVMATGADHNYGRTPCGFSLFERYALGFATPQLISTEGIFSLEALNKSNTGYRLNTPVRKEFFMIENRQKSKWDSALPGHGMLIFRVDSTNNGVWNYNSVNDNPDHPYYELLRAGGVKSDGYSVSAASSSDPFPGSQRVTTINNDTSPNLKTWTGKKPNFLGLRNINERNGIITFETYNVNILTSISFPSDSYKLSVGTQLQLTTIAEPESASSYELNFVSDNDSVATVDDEGLVTALNEGVANITAIANDSITATCTVTVTLLNEVPDIASFLAMDEGDDALLLLTDAQVLYVFNDEIYLRDATGSIILKGTGLSVSKYDVLNGNILGKLSYNNLMPQLIPADGELTTQDISISSGETPLPKEIFGDELTADRYADMVLVKGLTLVRDGGIFAVIDDRRVRLWNKFQIKSPKISLPSNIVGKFYDVTAIYGTDVINGEVVDELYVLSSPVEGEDPDAISAPLAQEPSSQALYNLYGQKVGKYYKGIVVKSGHKFIQK